MLKVTKTKNKHIFPAFYRARGRNRVVLFIEEHKGLIVGGMDVNAGLGLGDLCDSCFSCMDCDVWERVEVKVISDYTNEEVIQFPILCEGLGGRVVLFFDAVCGVELLPVSFLDVLKGKKNRFEVGACRSWPDANNSAIWQPIDSKLS